MTESKNNLAYADGTTDNHQRLTDWAKEPSVMTLKDDLKVAKSPHDVQVGKIQGWLNLRNVEGSAKPKITSESRSKVQPKLVRRQNEWRYSALSEPFLSADKVISVSPRTWEDVKSAEQNEMLLNYQLETKMNWVQFIDEYVRTVTDEGTAIVRLGWERHTVQETIQVPEWTYYSITDQAQMDMLNQALQLEAENHNAYLDLPEEVREAVNYAKETNTPAVAEITGYVEATQEKVVKNQPTLEVMDFENVYLDPTCNGNIDKANFVIISFETSKAELIKDGRYQNLDQVLWSGSTPYMEPDHASRTDDSTQFRDELRKRIVAYEYWGFYDIDGNDVLVPIVATWIGNTMIRMEKNPFPDQKLPIVVVTYLPVKKSMTGEPDAELLGDNQAILGAVTRGIIDLMGRSANGQTGFAKGMLDAVNRKRYNAGADYEFNPNMPPAAGMFQHKYPEIPQSALTVLQLQNQEAEALTGVKAFSGGLSGAAYGDVAAGIRGMVDAASKREMNILRRLAKGVEQMAMKMAAMNAAFLSEEEVVRITNTKFQNIRREDLAGTFDIRVDISTPEIEESKAQDLAFMLQTLGNNMDFNMVKMILAEIAKLKRMPELSHSIKNFQQTPDPMQEQMHQLEMQKLQAEIAEIQSKTQYNQSRALAEQSTADITDLDYVEQATGTKHARDMDRQEAQAAANSRLEITKRILQPDNVSKAQDVKTAVQYQNFANMLTNAQ